MAERPPAVRTPWLLIAVFGVLAVALAAMGWIARQSQQAWLLDVGRRSTAGASRVRADEVLAWRYERLADGAALRSNRHLNALSEQVLAGQRPEAEAEWDQQVGLVLTRRDYVGAALVDDGGRVRHATGTLARDWLERTWQPDDAAPPVTLSDPAVIDAREEGLQLRVRLQESRAAVVLQIDAARDFAHVLRGRVLPMSSMEAYLLRGSPRGLVFLGPSGPGAPFRVGDRVSGAPSEVVARHIQHGEQGLFEGPNLRGVQSIVAAKAVADTGWWVVCAVSTEAILGSTRADAWRLAVMTTLAIVIAGVAMLLAWQRKQAGLYKQLYQAELSRQALVESFDHLTRFANDVIVLADENGIIVEANERAQETYGYSRDEIIGLAFSMLRAPEIRERTAEDMRQLVAEGNFSYTANHVRKNGETFPVEVRARHFVRDGRSFFHGIIRDVTERMAMEGQLRESAERYRSLFESANDAIVLADAETGTILDVNRKTAELLGYAAEELRGRHHSEIHPVGRREEAKQNLRGRLTGEKTDSQAVELFTKDGRWIPVEVSASRLELRGRMAVLGIFRDLTERREAEEAIRESERRFRSIVESNPAGIHLYRLDPGGRLIFEGANPAADRMLGVSHTSLVGLPIEEAWPGLVGTEVPDRYRAVCRDGASWSVEALPYSNGGVEGTYEVRAFQTGENRAAVMFLDITEQQKAREAVRRSEESYRVAAEQTGQLLYDVDVATRRVEWRGAITALTGYSPEEYAPVGLAERIAFVHPEDRAAAEAQWEQAVANMAEFRYEYRYRRKDGSYFLAEDHGVCLPASDRQHVRALGTLRDVTASRAAEEELRQSETRRQKLESLALLAGGIAHDFNNLLTGIVGNLSLAVHDTAPGGDLRTSLEEAERAGLRAQELTRQLLTFSKGGAPIKKVVELGRLVRETVTFACRGTSVRPLVKLPDAPLTAEVDEGQIGQVINNIAINAVQAMPAGGTLTVSASLVELPHENAFGLPAGNYARVSLLDTGIGIPQALLERVFDPYFTTKQQGSGLGLAISHSIVSRHGGTIGVKSEVGSGSEFEVFLPAAGRAESSARTELPPAAPGLGGGRVLVMDDEEQVRNLALRMLERLGFETMGVPDGERTIAAYREAREQGRPFTLVIMDLTITGGMGGKEAVGALLALDPGARVIVSSGYSNDPIMASFAEYGFAAVLPKPYRLQQMKETLARVLPTV
jgi:PAS domain S-box-containing protein